MIIIHDYLMALLGAWCDYSLESVSTYVIDGDEAFSSKQGHGAQRGDQ